MTHVLVVLGLAAAYTVFLIVFPTTACGCAGRCRRCRGTGRRFRLGARTVHRGVVAVVDGLRRKAGSK